MSGAPGRASVDRGQVTHSVAGALVDEDGTGAVLVEVLVDALLGALCASPSSVHFVTPRE